MTAAKQLFPSILVQIAFLLGLGLALMLLAFGLSTVKRDVSFKLTTAEIQHQDGYAYRVPLKHRLSWPWQPIGDNSKYPFQSRLALYEGSVRLGPPHSRYDQVRSVGGGSYLHWGNALLFSSSDQTDPRVNGRSYSGVLWAGISPQLLRQLARLGAVMSIAAIAVILWFRPRLLAAIVEPRILTRASFTLLLLGVALVLSAVGLRSLVRQVPIDIYPKEIQHLAGHAYQVPVEGRLNWPWKPISDNETNPYQSRLTLYEDAEMIGPPHTGYERVQSVGGGRYAHWKDLLLFSSSDRSDPRANGRRYSGSLEAGISPVLLRGFAQVGALFIVAALGMIVWIRRGYLLNQIRCSLSNIRTRLIDFGVAAFAPALSASLMFFLMPPMWNGSDSVIWLLWQWELVPHHPPAYPALMALAHALLDDNDAILNFTIAVQQLWTVFGVVYLASAFRLRWQILVISLVGTIGAVGGLYAQGLYTEGLATPFFLIFLGALLRLDRDGATWPVLIGLGIGLSGSALTRHAYLFFAIIPLAYLLASAVLRPTPRGKAAVRQFLLLGLLVGGVAFANGLVVQYTCLMLDSRCSSIIGRAGVYRMQDAFAMVPKARQHDWLTALSGRASDALVAEVIPAMVTTPGPWTGPRDAIVRNKASWGESVDRLMNEAFIDFLFWPERHALLQWLQGMGHAAFGPGGSDHCSGHPSCVLLDSARSVESTLRIDPRSLEAVAGTGADEPDAEAQYRVLANHPLTRAADLLLPILPDKRAFLVVASILLGIAAVIRIPTSGFAALIVSLWAGTVTYIVTLTLVTVVLPRYLLPIDNLLWLSNGIAMIAFFTPRSTRELARR